MFLSRLVKMLNTKNVSVSARQKFRTTFEVLEGRELYTVNGTVVPFVGPVQARIVNGQGTSAYPAVGLVGSDGDHGCSGTLIAPRYVLTAGHCAEGVANTAGIFTVNGQTYGTSRVFVHPGYNSDAIGSDAANDIAIYELSRSVVGVTPMPINRTVPRVGQVLTLVGFGGGGTGSTGTNGDFGIKRVGTTPIDSVTSRLIQWDFDNNSESNTAPGDSGGPAFLTLNGVKYVAGVTSGGDSETAGIGDHSFDTRVDAYAAWIDSIAKTSGTTSPPVTPPKPADDHGNRFSNATLLTLSGVGAGSAVGSIEKAGDLDVFRMKATVTGQLTINLRARTEDLDSYLRVFDGAGKLLAQNDDISDFNTDSRVRLNVVAGRTYYIQASGFDGSTGPYTLTLGTVGARSAGKARRADTDAFFSLFALEAERPTRTRCFQLQGHS